MCAPVKGGAIWWCLGHAPRERNSPHQVREETGAKRCALGYSPMARQAPLAAAAAFLNAGRQAFSLGSAFTVLRANPRAKIWQLDQSE